MDGWPPCFPVLVTCEYAGTALFGQSEPSFCARSKGPTPFPPAYDEPLQCAKAPSPFPTYRSVVS